jgi:hypothetical protein
MKDTFDVRLLTGDNAIVFDHLAVESLVGASVFWIKRSAAMAREAEAIEYWQVKRDGSKRGIVEVVGDDYK